MVVVCNNKKGTVSVLWSVTQLSIQLKTIHNITLSIISSTINMQSYNNSEEHATKVELLIWIFPLKKMLNTVKQQQQQY